MNLIPLPAESQIGDRLIEATLAGIPSRSTRRAYAGCLRDFLRWWRSSGPTAFDRDAVHQYRLDLESRVGASRVNQALAAISHLARECLAHHVIDHETADGITGVKRITVRGSRTGRWLDEQQVRELMNAVGSPTTGHGTLQRLRDQAVLGLLLGAGLRREEVSRATVAQLEQRDGRWCLVNMENKGRVRTIALPDWVYNDIRAWMDASGVRDGNLIRGFNGRHMLAAFSGQSVHNTASAYGVRPHDLRRTFTSRNLENGATLLQIMNALGHSQLSTTQKYVNSLATMRRGSAACDFAPNPKPGLTTP